MKLALASLLAAFAASSAFATPGTILVQDDFSGSSLDGATWQEVLPFFSSSVDVSGGAAVLHERGTIATQAAITAPYVIGGTVRIPSFDGMFTISLRSDLGQESTYGATTGITVNFVAEFNSIQIQALSANGSSTPLVPDFGYSFDTFSSYDFEIADDGSNISLSINGTTLAEFSSNFSTGDHVAFFSRETSGSYAELDSVTITTTASAVPEPSSFAALAGLAGLGLAATRRRRVG